MAHLPYLSVFGPREVRVLDQAYLDTLESLSLFVDDGAEIKKAIASFIFAFASAKLEQGQHLDASAIYESTCELAIDKLAMLSAAEKRTQSSPSTSVCPIA